MTAKTEAHAATPGRADADGVRSPRCSLDAPGMRRQRARYRGLARSLRQMSRHGDRLVVDFAPDLDRRALEQVLALERECCPFFCFSFAGMCAASRKLTDCPMPSWQTVQPIWSIGCGDSLPI